MGSILIDPSSYCIIFQEMTELHFISQCGYNNSLVEGFVLGLTYIIIALIFIEINNIINEIDNTINDGNTSDKKK